MYQKLLIICYTVPEILGCFLPSPWPNSLKKQNFKKKNEKTNKTKKTQKNKTTTTTTTTWRYHFRQVYQKSWLYAILFLRYMVCDGCNCYFSFLTIFCPFTALTAWKTKIWIKKKHLEVSPFDTSVPKIMIICYTVPEIYGVWWM